MRIHEILQNSSHMQSTAGNVERPTISDCDVLVKLLLNDIMEVFRQPCIGPTSVFEGRNADSLTISGFANARA
jgi:hypothetical protein